MTKPRLIPGVVVLLAGLCLLTSACGRTSLRRVGSVQEDGGAADGDASAERREGGGDTSPDTSGVQSLTISPDSTQIMKNDVASFTATVVMNDGSSQDVTALVKWSSSDETVAAPNGPGSFFGLLTGPVTITATYGELQASAQLTIVDSNVHVDVINIDPPSPTLIGIGSTLQLHAWAVYSDGHRVDVTSLPQCVWSSATPSLVTVAAGKATAVAAGASKVSATFGGITGEAPVMVTTATVTSIAVSPATRTISVGGKATFTAEATLSDGSHQDVTANAIWSSSTPSVASVVGGIATGLQAGNTTIDALLNTVHGSASLTVSTATLSSIEISPLDPTIGVGVTLKFAVTGHFSDGSTRDVSAQATWTSSSTSVLSIDGTGSAQSRGAGTSVVTAVVSGQKASSTVTVTAALLRGITVSPAAHTLALKGSVQLTATGIYTDGTVVDLTSSVIWSSSPTGVVTVSNVATSPGLVTALASGTATVTASFGAVSGSAKVTVSPAALTKLAIVPPTTTVTDGMTVQLRVLGSYADGNTLDVTAQATWSSSNNNLATVSNAAGTQGFVTGVNAGQVTITAALSGQQATASVTVTAAVLTKITVSPAAGSVFAGQKLQYTAVGTYSDGTSSTITTQVVWSTGNQTIATISSSAGTQGQLTARTAGSTTVTATLGSVAGSAAVTVIGPVLTGIIVTPALPSTPAGGWIQFTANAVYSDNTVTNVTGAAVWTSSATKVATIDSAGAATALVPGTTTITASYQGLSGSSTLTVTAAVVTGLQISPLAPSLTAISSVQFQALAKYSDGSSKNVTTLATWTSSNTVALSITASGANAGWATAMTAGTSTVTVSYANMAASTNVTVLPAVVTSVTVTPAASSLTVGGTRYYTARANYSDGTSTDVTGSATWTSGSTAIATVSNTGTTRGLVTAVGAGTVEIRATYMSVTGTGSLTVTVPVPTSIKVTPNPAAAAVGSPVQFQAIAVFNDGTTQNVTAQANWTSSNAVVAAISNAAGSKGLATTWAAGSSTITATYQNVSGSSTLTVNTATIKSIAITPAKPSVPVGFTQQLAAIATYSDNSTSDVTAQATWTSSAGTVVSVSDAAGSKGRASALLAGSATIQAQVQGISGTTVVTAANVTLTSISVSPNGVGTSVNGIVQFSATGLFSDGGTRDITSAVLWSSSNVAVADVSNAAESIGQAKAYSPGTTTITAQLNTAKGSATLTVK